MNARIAPAAPSGRTGLDDVAAGNRHCYDRPRIRRAYARAEGLQPAEAVVLARLAPDVRGRPLLDLGVGAGRTTPAMLALSSDYLAVDVSAAMVAACRRAHPGVRVERLDARDLRPLADGAFALVLFSFNGIDYVAPEDRPAVLREVRRVLRPGGWFAFSSHNLAVAPTRFRLPGLPPGRDPLRRAAHLARWPAVAVRSVRNRRRLAGAARRGDGWALVNDPAHEYGLLTVYVDPAAQRRALAEAGFAGDVEQWDADGRPLPHDGAASTAWVWYAVRA